MTLRYAIGSNANSTRNALRFIEIDDATGRFHETSSILDSANPIYFALSADGRFLYVPELLQGSGHISVYAHNDGGAFSRIQSLPCAPTAPCHISLAPNGKFLAWAEYSNALTGTFAIEPDGTLRGPIARIHHTGHGPNPKRQESAHCHYAAITPEGDQFLVCDLGIDTIVSYRLDPDGTLTHEPDFDFHGTPGAGPRHLAFHPNGQWVYLVNELASSVRAFQREGHRLTPIGPELSMLPPDSSVETKAAAIRISPDGTQLIASNRGHDSLAIYTICPNSGALSLLAISPLAGCFPRDFVFLPSGRILLVAHKMSHEFASYAYDPATGALSLIQRSAKLFRPLAFQQL